MGYCKKVFPALAFCIVLTLVLAACGGGGGGGTPATGGASTLTAQSAADIANCPTGGVALDYGIDDNKNGALDASEIDGTEYICNGTDGATGPQGTDGLTALVATSPADIANCPAGGTMIEIGIDANSNNVLDPEEVDPALTDYICNPTAPNNTAPAADAGPDETASTGFLVTLDGSGSSDAELDSLTYAWSFVIKPAGSTAVLNDTSAESPFFTPDVEGTYALSLSVSDGRLFSAADYVMITPKAWGGAKPIDAGANNASDPHVAVDADGNAFAVWYQYNGTYQSIYANIYNGTDWEGAEIIDAGDYNADSPQVAVDAGGNAFAVWRQFDGTSTYDIYANRYVAGTGWTGAQPIETGDGGAYNPQVAVDSDGNAFAVWQQFDGTSTYDIYANRYVAGTGWGTAVPIDDAGANNAYSPQVAFDAGGSAFAVWKQYESTYDSIYANIYNGTDWEGAEIIDAGDYNAYNPQLAVDAGGNAFAVWYQWDGTSAHDIYANRYVAGTGWGTAELIETGLGTADGPQVAVDSGGNAVAVWNQWDGTYQSIYANRYVAGTGWTGAVVIDAGDNTAGSLHVAVDAGGNAFAVWNQLDGISAYAIYANRYVAGTGWTGALVIDAGGGDAINPQVAFDAGGNAVAVWQQDDGTRNNIHANRYE